MSFTCPVCGAEFETQDALEAHGREEQQTDMQAAGGFRCPVCGAEFESQDGLDAHARDDHAA